MVNRAVTPLPCFVLTSTPIKRLVGCITDNGNGERLPHWDSPTVLQFISPRGTETLLSSSEKMKLSFRLLFDRTLYLMANY